MTDAIADELTDMEIGDERYQKLKPLIKKNLPVKLADMAWDRVESHFPISYQRHAIASTLASTMVYAEGK